MKVLSLNLWGGMVYEPLMQFIKEHVRETDVFCFQEMIFGDVPGFTNDAKVRKNLSVEIDAILSDFDMYSYLAKEGSYFGGEDVPLQDGSKMGQAIYIRKGIEVVESGGVRTYAPDGEHSKDPAITVTGNFQWIDINKNDQTLTIGNLHGAWVKNSKKLDTPERLEQSRIVLECLKDKEKVVLIGDFNVRPDTQSIAMLSEKYTDLISKYGVTSTRTKFYGKPDAIQFSDYAFTSPNIQIISFDILKDEVSDHSPLLLEFEV